MPAVQVKNVSGKPTTATVPSGENGRGGTSEVMTMASPRNVQERLGAVHTPQVSFAPQEDPAAGANLRNMRILAPAKSYNGGFFEQAG